MAEATNTDVEVEASAPTVPTAPIWATAKKDFQMPSAAEYIAKVLAGGSEWAEFDARLRAAAPDVVTTDTPGILPTPIVEPVYNNFRRMRPLVEGMGVRAMPGGGKVFISKELKNALEELRSERNVKSDYVVTSERGEKMSAQSITNHFHSFYKRLGFEGASGHSGRRTAITNAARKISSVGGSMRDVQSFARHASLTTTQRYVQVSEDALRALADKI